MNIKDELNNLTTSDIYSLMLFVLYKTTEIPEYSTLSQLAYLLDKDSLLKLCEFYGGLTITIPKISDLEQLLNSLLMYQLIDIEGKPLEEVQQKYDKHTIKLYVKVKQVLKDYNFNSGRFCDV